MPDLVGVVAAILHLGGGRPRQVPGVWLQLLVRHVLHGLRRRSGLSGRSDSDRVGRGKKGQVLGTSS